MKNLIILIGHVGQQPEVKTLQNGAKVAKFSLATSEKWTDKQGQKKENTDWHNCECWEGLAGVVESYVKKGSLLYIEGQQKNEQYQDELGVTKYRHFVRVKNLQMLDKKT